MWMLCDKHASFIVILPRKLSRRSEETGKMGLKTADSASVPLSGGAPTGGRGDREGRGPVGRVSGAPFGKEWASLTPFC